MFNVLFGILTVVLNFALAIVSIMRGGPAAVLIGINYGPILNGLLLLAGLAFVPFAECDRGRRLVVVALLPLAGIAIQLILMLLSSAP